MKTTLSKGTRLFAGDQPVELVADSEVDFVGVADVDGLAAAMSNASHTIYGAHVARLAHDETVQKTVDGELCEVDVAVTYGAHGARIETPKGDPRPIKVSAAVAPPRVGTPRVEAPAASDAAGQQAVNTAAEQPPTEDTVEPAEPPPVEGQGDN